MKKLIKFISLDDAIKTTRSNRLDIINKEIDRRIKIKEK